MPLTPSPPAPSTGDPDNFDPEGDAFLAWMEDNLVPEINALEANVEAKQASAVASAAAASVSELAASSAANAAMTATGLMRFSSATLAIGTGAKAVTGLNSPSAASFANGQEISLISAADAEVRMWGIASSVNAGAGTMTVTVASGDFAGSGSPTSWIVIHRAFEGLLGATAAEILAMATNIKAMTPAAWKAALAPAVLTPGTTVAPNGLNGLDFTLAAAQNFTLNAITNTYPGATGSISITQDATGSRILATSSVWKPHRGILGVLSTTAAKVDELQYRVKSVDGSNNATRIVYGILNDVG